MLGKLMTVLVLAGALALGLTACSSEGSGDEDIVKPMEDYREAAQKSIDDSNASEELDAIEREIEAEGE